MVAVSRFSSQSVKSLHLLSLTFLLIISPHLWLDLLIGLFPLLLQLTFSYIFFFLLHVNILFFTLFSLAVGRSSNVRTSVFSLLYVGYKLRSASFLSTLHFQEGKLSIRQGLAVFLFYSWWHTNRINKLLLLSLFVCIIKLYFRIQKASGFNSHTFSSQSARWPSV
jgi:hypothetical protein